MLLMGASFTACSDDDNYVPGAESAGVFFTASDPASIVLSKKDNQPSFTISVSRVGVTEAATYPVVFTVSDPDGVFTLPSSVSFAQNATTTDLIVGCELSKAAFDSSFPFEVNFGEGAQVYLYGKNTYNFTVSIPSAWTDWKPFMTGDCCWYYDLAFIMSGDDPGLPIYYRQNEVNENIQQFRIEHWGNDVTLEMDYDKSTGFISIPPQFTGIDGINGEYDLFVCDMHTFCETYLDGQYYTGWADLIQYGSSYDEETGMMYLNLVYYSIDETNLDNESHGAMAWNGGAGFETCQVGGFPDYSLSMKYKGLYTEADTETSYAIITTNVGSGFTDAKIMISKDLNADQITKQILAGSEDAVSVASGSDNTVLKLGGQGRYTAVMVGFDGNEAQNTAIISFAVDGANISDHDWRPYGEGAIIDGWFMASWQLSYQDGTEANYEDLVWGFPVERDAANKNLFRLVNVWTQEECPMVYLELNKIMTPRSIIIDVTNPQAVSWVPQLSGYGNPQYGAPFTDELYCANDIGFYVYTEGVTTEELVELGYTCPIEDDIFEVAECLFGATAEECQYNWTSVPYGMVALSLDEGNGVISKFKARQNLKDQYKVRGILNSMKPRKVQNMKFATKGTMAPLSGEIHERI